MSQRKAKPESWRLSDARPWTPRKEWVEMNDGRAICVWQLSITETLQLSAYSQRHPNDPRPGPDEAEATIWQLALSCRVDDEPGSPRVFSDQDARRVLELDPEDFSRLLEASARLMGIGKEAANGREAFTGPAPAGSSRA